eukprot:TRINITY_DN34106_c0_g1_i5.p1 TRINITY_DN34106_c0_g1~~TRINITY_DN34106_c0_g1_i5.p1  ORF type:complete len:318 (+),score=73.30 TRINITY_DN34106_c0_g1_i5:119-1072(+)
MRVSEEVVDIAAELEAVTQRVDKLFQVLLPPAACSEVWAASLHLLSGCVNFLQSWQRSLAAASPPPATLLQQSAFTRDVRSDLELSVSSVSLCSIDDIVAGSSTRPSLCRDGSDGHCGEEMAALELSQPGSKGGNTAAPGALQAMAARQLEELRNDCRQHVAELQRRLDSERSLLHQFVEAEVATLFSTWSSCDALLAPADEHTRLRTAPGGCRTGTPGFAVAAEAAPACRCAPRRGDEKTSDACCDAGRGGALGGGPREFAALLVGEHSGEATCSPTAGGAPAAAVATYELLGGLMCSLPSQRLRSLWSLLGLLRR